MIPHIHFFLIASVMLHLFFKFQDILQCKNLCESYVEIKYTQTHSSSTPRTMMSRKRADVAFGCNKKEYDASTDAKAIQELARPTPSIINVNWFFFETKIDLFHIRLLLQLRL